MPKVSVVVPYYNHKSFIEECLLSILNQSFKDFELIVIDDGSPDDGYKIIEKYAKEYGFRFIRKENEGICATLNLGLSLGKGEFFCAIASDDIMLSSRLHKQVEFIESKGFDCISAQAKVFYSLKDESLFLGNLISRHGFQKYDFDDIVLYRASIPALNLMWRRKTLLSLGGYSLDTKLEDLDSLLRFTSSGGKVYVMDEVCSLYRVHKGNTSSNRVMIAQERIKILENYRAFSPVIISQGIDMARFIKSYNQKNIKDIIQLIGKLIFRKRLVSSITFFIRLIAVKIRG